MIAAPRSLWVIAGAASATLDDIALSSISLLLAVNVGEALGPSVSVLFGEAAIRPSIVVSSGKICVDSLTSAGLATPDSNVESLFESPAPCKAARDSMNSEKPAHDISTG
jgi:hypothetical protein